MLTPKKIWHVILFSILVLLPLSFKALANDQSSGCGVGWMILKENSLVSSSLRASTNATFLNTIAMTFGTSGCAKHKIVEKEKAPLHFAQANYQQLMVDSARGDGEYLLGFATTLGVCNYQSFKTQIQENFKTIYGQFSDTPASQIVEVASAFKSCSI